MIELQGVTVTAGGFTLHSIAVTIPAHHWGIVIGPAGSGKTTLLETVAGIRRPTAGKVFLRGDDVTRLSPERRKIGIVYQHGHLFPHLSVEQNVAYGARDPGVANEMSKRFGVTALYDRNVASLSGGERQLVALARALAPQPDVLLLDEPFGALDPRRRNAVRATVRELQRERRFTVLHVTHDFAEAGMLGDELLVLENGAVVQSGKPAEVFRSPASGAIAEFLGAENVLTGLITPMDGSDMSQARMHQFNGDGLKLTGVGVHAGGPGHAVIRADNITLLARSPENTSARNNLPVRVTGIERDGVLVRIHLDAGATSLTSIITRDAAESLGIEEGRALVASIKATAVYVC